MSYRDAAIVATVLMLVSVATVYMPTHGYDVYISDPQRFSFELETFAFSSWVTNFAALKGIAIVVSRRESGDGKESG